MAVVFGSPILLPWRCQRVFVVAWFFSFLFISFSFGQSFNLLYQKNGAAAGNYFGISVASAGDVNGDGKADFIVGAPYATPDTLGNAGAAYLYSGANGILLFQKNGETVSAQKGSSVASAGDVNADGKADFIVGAMYDSPDSISDAGSAYVYSGVDGSLLYQRNGSAAGDNLGVSVASAGDANGDGRDDFIIGAYRTDPGGFLNAGSAYLYSGADGSLLYQKDGIAAGDQLGICVASAGDVNGDGQADFIIGAVTADPGGRADAGSAYLYSGADGSLLYQKDGIAAGDRLGRSVDLARDVNGDGRGDFIVGAFRADPGGRINAGSAYVYSGFDGSLLYQKDGDSAGDQLGFPVASAGDVDGDGKADFILGIPNADPNGNPEAGSIYLYSGADGSLLYQKDGDSSGDFLGVSAASAGDVNGDGKADIIMGAYFADPNGLEDAGKAYVYGLTDFSCVSVKGDMNGVNGFTPADVVLMLNCVFSGNGNGTAGGDCNLCYADMNCSNGLSPADVVIELNLVFRGDPPPC